jgi:hypothetical protein
MIFCGLSRGAGKSRVVEPGINSVGQNLAERHANCTLALFGVNEKMRLTAASIGAHLNIQQRK